MACVMRAAGCRGLADTERLSRRFPLVNNQLPHRSICAATSWPLFLSNPLRWAAECSGGAPSRLRLLCPGSVLSPFCLGHFQPLSPGLLSLDPLMFLCGFLLCVQTNILVPAGMSAGDRLDRVCPVLLDLTI